MQEQDSKGLGVGGGLAKEGAVAHVLSTVQDAPGDAKAAEACSWHFCVACPLLSEREPFI